MLRIGLPHIIAVLLISNACYASEEVLDEVKKSIVKIQCGQTERATGFFWQNGYTIVTVFHAVKNPNATIRFLPNTEGAKWLSVSRIVYRNPANDIAVLEIDTLKYKSSSFIKNKRERLMAVGERCYAMGFGQNAINHTSRIFWVGSSSPYLIGVFPEKKEYAYLDEFRLIKDSVEVVYLDGGSLLPGFSGSPVVDMNGYLVGIGHGGLGEGTIDYSWCIKSKYLEYYEKSLPIRRH